MYEGNPAHTSSPSVPGAPSRCLRSCGGGCVAGLRWECSGGIRSLIPSCVLNLSVCFEAGVRSQYHCRVACSAAGRFHSELHFSRQGLSFRYDPAMTSHSLRKKTLTCPKPEAPQKPNPRSHKARAFPSQVSEPQEAFPYMVQGRHIPFGQPLQIPRTRSQVALTAWRTAHAWDTVTFPPAVTTPAVPRGRPSCHPARNDSSSSLLVSFEADRSRSRSISLPTCQIPKQKLLKSTPVAVECYCRPGNQNPSLAA